MNMGQSTLESMSQAVWYNQWTLNKIKKYLKGNILEVGCGIGNFTKSLTELGRVTAIDISQSYIQEVLKEFKKGVSVGLGNIESGKYFFKNKQFNSIVCLNVLEHIENDSQAIQNLYQLLNPQGFLVIIVPAHQFLYGEIDRSIGHYRRYSLSDISQKLHSSGLKIIKHRRLNVLGAVGWFISGKLYKDRIVGSNKIKIFNFVGPVILPLEDLIEPPFGTSFLIIAQKVL